MLHKTHPIDKKILPILAHLQLKKVNLRFYARPKEEVNSEFQLYIYESVLLKLEGDTITLQVTQTEPINLDEYEIFKDCYIDCVQGTIVYKFLAHLLNIYHVTNRDFIIFSDIVEIEEFNDKRRFPRVKIKTPITYWIDLPEVKEKMSRGVLIDLSEGGFQFASMLSLKADIPVGVKFTLPTLGTLTAMGEVRWGAETTNTNYYGVQFTILDDDNKRKISILVNDILKKMD
jgi:c-di-GMP-binding flagellar brake protein YcgR